MRLFIIGRNLMVSLLLLNPENKSDNDAKVGALKVIWIMDWQLACSALTCAADSGDLESIWHSLIVTLKFWSTTFIHTYLLPFRAN